MNWKDLRYIVEQLAEALDHVPHDEARILALLDTLCASGDARALVPLLAVLWPCAELHSSRSILGKPHAQFRSRDLKISPTLRYATGTRLMDFLARFPTFRLREIDHAIRRAGRDHWAALLRGTGWTIWLKPPEPDALWAEPSRTAQLCLLACHANGHVREAAIVALRGDKTGMALPFIMLRTMDWVEPVARRAMAACELIIARTPEHLVESLPLISNLQPSIRPPAQWLYTHIGEVLTGESQRELLLSALRHADRRVARVAAIFATVLEGDALEACVSAAMLSRDATLRRIALRWEARLRPTAPEFAAGLRAHFLQDKAAPLRAEALRLHVTLEGDSGVLKHALLDPAPIVRDTARFYLRKLMTAEEFASFYRAAASTAKSSAVIAAALCGVGELGGQADTKLLRGFLGATPRIAKAAMRGLVRLDPAAARGLLLNLLADRRAGVQRQALRLLDARLTNADAAILRGHLVNDDMADRRPLALAMLRLPIWENLSCLLDLALNDPSAADAALHQWRAEARPNYAPPKLDKVDGDRLQGSLSAVANKLDEHVAGYIGRELALWTQD
jgi:hypothetical protein